MATPLLDAYAKRGVVIRIDEDGNFHGSGLSRLTVEERMQLKEQKPRLRRELWARHWDNRDVFGEDRPGWLQEYERQLRRYLGEVLTEAEIMDSVRRMEKLRRDLGDLPPWRGLQKTIKERTGK